MIVSLYILLEVLTVVYFLHYLYGEKVKPDILTIGVILLETVGMKLIDMLQMNAVYSLTMYVVFAVYCAIKFRFDLKAIFINNILWMLLLSILQILMMWFVTTIFHIESISDTATLFINGFNLMIVITLFGKFHLDKVAKVLQSNEVMIVASLLIICAGILLCLVSYKQNQGFHALCYIILLIGFAFVGAVIIDITNHKMKTKQIETELRMHQLYEQSFQNLIDDISMRQHEFDNHISTIFSQHFVHTTYDELVNAQKNYCNQIINVNKNNKLLSKGNSLVLGFLYGKFLEAERYGITVNYNVKIGELECRIPIYKIIELCGNLLNNAIDALKEETEKTLCLEMLEDENEIIIGVKNNCSGIDYKKMQNFFKKGYTTKGEKHGIGLCNVKRICDEYQVKIENMIDTEENIDVLQIILYINKTL